ncbi:pseudouridine synthase [Entophlyctis helioformis]|nr:pseudouridine synthase [Entophlyctis helioformis]
MSSSAEPAAAPAVQETRRHTDWSNSVAATEADLGILEYISRSTPAFTGIIKHRYSDFLVNEVDLSGEIVHLRETSMATPEQAASAAPAAVSTPAPDAEVAAAAATTEEKDVPAKLAELAAVLQDEDIIPEIQALLDATGADAKKVVMTKSIPEKNTRTLVHQTVRSLFAGQLDTYTEKDAIAISRPTAATSRRNAPASRKGNNGKSKVKASFADLGGEFCHFTLYKENMDTMQALSMLAKTIRVPQQSFTFSGTKDRRAVTVQRISVHRVRPDVLLGLNRRIRNARIGDLKYTTERLALGSLAGNHFTIALRNVEAESEDAINQSLESFKKLGFINYYGMQRFGTRSIPTYAVGLEMLSGNWAAAIDLVMCAKGDEDPDIIAAREHWFKYRDAQEAYEMFSPRLLAERSVLKAYASMGNTHNHLGALQAIPRSLRLMYVHAYQSLVWNHMASERVRMYGHTPVIGDLVRPLGVSDTDLDIADDADADADTLPATTTTDTAGTAGTETATTAAAKGHLSNRKNQPVIIETAEQAAQYTMADVLLPMPGHAILYPRNAIMDMYKEFMGKHGFDPLDMTRKIKEFSLTGSYRPVVSMPRNVSWRMLRYNDDHMPLVQTDLDIIERKPVPESIPDGKKLALVVEFTLGASQYATMALREITKTDTGSRHQTSLSRETKRKEADDPETAADAKKIKTE